MTEFHITKKWKEKGKVLRSIIHNTVLGNNKFKFKFKSFTAAADDHKVHNNCDHAHACIEDIKNKTVNSSVFCKVGLLPSLVRVPSSGFKKIGRVVSMRRHQAKLEDDDEEGGSLELCKKRIMMGKKCRPLNISGVLRYDKYGVLVPEDLLISPLNHPF